ncbi:tetratricopeptide repeat protein 1 [Athalia rosae]|uniref:tetratricopeptide repeat protein 1 n=1 Tax=Athalia rosae TaxID=37344 RepID=UPI002033DAF2|nr:tetratricopeptide repeat protein 1 [Athalia rosae]
MDNSCPNRLQSNEEIIEELTRDLAESAIKITPETERTNEDLDFKETSVDDKTTKSCTSGTNNDPFADIGKDDQESDDATKVNELPDDFVDEEALKDREVELTDDQREELKKEAQYLKNEGNELFKNGEYQKAMVTYTRGLQTCPLAFDKDRAILYANRAASKIKYMDEKESAISDCTKAVELNPSYVKAYLRRALLYEETDKLDEALEDFKKILTFDPAHSEANYAVRRLPPLIAERNEKLKTEMMGKLKDLGNLVLRPFGLSTDNFELKQDPNSGGYSVNFTQNPR